MEVDTKIADEELLLLDLKCKRETREKNLKSMYEDASYITGYQETTTKKKLQMENDLLMLGAGYHPETLQESY